MNYEAVIPEGLAASILRTITFNPLRTIALYSPLPRPQQRAAPVNRAERRLARRQARRDGTLVLTPLSEVMDRDAAGRMIDTPGEVMVSRLVASAEKQAGKPLPAQMRDQLSHAFRTQLHNLERTHAGQAPIAAAIDFTPEQEADGARLLEELLPLARGIAASVRRSGRAAEMRPLAVAPTLAVVPLDAPATLDQTLVEALAANNFTLDDLKALLVYEAPVGWPAGWHADVALKRHMHPYPDVFGTRVARPCATREEALREAMRHLVTFVLFAEGGGE